MAEMVEIKLTENCEAVLQWMRANDCGDEGYFGADIAAALGLNPKGIHGVMNSLVKNELVAKGSREAAYTDKAGKTGTKPYTTYHLTDAGRAFGA
jgi:predicted ArsR family transcriptional regulator